MRTGKGLGRRIVFAIVFLILWGNLPQGVYAEADGYEVSRANFDNALKALINWENPDQTYRFSVKTEEEDDGSSATVELRKEDIGTESEQIWLQSEKTEGSETVNIYIVSDGAKEVYLPSDCAGLFDIKNADSENSFRPKIEDISLKGLCTSNVTTMQRMFGGCCYLMHVDVSDFDISNVTDLSKMFDGCSELADSPELGSFDTGKVTEMTSMFEGCQKLEVLDLSSFDTSKVTRMSSMFKDCTRLQTIQAGDGWVTTQVTASEGMFAGCTSIVGHKNMSYDAEKTNALYATVIKDEESNAKSYLNYVKRYTLTTVAEKAEWGTVSVKNESGTVKVSSALKGTRLTLVATPAAGKLFKGWEITGGGILNDDTAALTGYTMPAADVTVKAVFEEEKLSLAASAVNFGTVERASAETAYTLPDAKTIEIRNTGNVNAVIKSVTAGDAYTVSELSAEESAKVVARGQTNRNWTIQPKSGRANGSHFGNITITYVQEGKEEQKTVTTQVSFTLKTPTAAVTSVEYTPKELTFQNGVTKDYIWTRIAADAPKTVNITFSNTTTYANGLRNVNWNLHKEEANDVLKNYDPADLDYQSFSITGSVQEIDDAAVSWNGRQPVLLIRVEAAEQLKDVKAAVTPALDTEPEYYEKNITVALSSEDGADIYYTMNSGNFANVGVSNPVAASSTNGTRKYNAAEPITVSGTEGETVTTVIKAIAHKDGMRDSNVRLFTYKVRIPVHYALDVDGDAAGGAVSGTVGEAAFLSAIDYREVEGTKVTLKATPDEKHIFKGWELETEASGFALADPQAQTISFEMPAAAVTLKPVFEEKKITLTVTAPSFAAVKKGYTPASGNITIKNDGNVAAVISAVTADSANFVIGGSGALVQPGERIATWTVTPKGGLGVGSYAGNVTVAYSGDHVPSAEKTASLSLTVEKAALSNISRPDDVTGIKNRTSWTDIIASKLPKTVAIKTENDAATQASVQWLQNDNYVLTKVEEQSFDVEGRVEIPEGIDPSDFTAQVKTNGSSFKHLLAGDDTISVFVHVTVMEADRVETPKAAASAAPSDGGSYSENLKVMLSSATGGAAIYYTMTEDGTEPSDPRTDMAGRKNYDDSAGIVLKGTHSGARTFRIKAYAVKEAMRDSETADFTYVVKLPPLYTMTVEPFKTEAYGKTGTGTVAAVWGQTLPADEDEFSLTQTGGVWTIQATEGTKVKLTGEPGVKSLFTQWKTAGGITAVFADALNEETTVTMPGGDTKLQAVFDPQRIALEAQDITFPAVKEGYGKPQEGEETNGVYALPQAQAVTVNNIGNTEGIISAVTVSGNDFTLARDEAQADNDKVPVRGENTAWTIQPKTGLGVGTHTARISVSYNDIDDNPVEATAEAQFTVIDKNKPTLSKVGALTDLPEFENGTAWETIEAAVPKSVSVDVDVAGENNTWEAMIDWDLALAKAAYDQKELDKQTVLLKGTVNLENVLDSDGAGRTVLNLNDAVDPDASLTVSIKRAPQVQKPVAEPMAGTDYTENQTVTISSNTVGADIYYTIAAFEGEADAAPSLPSEPSEGGEDSRKYAEPVAVTGEHGKVITTIIKAVAVKDGMWPSETAVFTYTIRLPKLYTLTVETQGSGTVTAKVDGEPAGASAQAIAGTPVTLTAEPADDYLFQKWEMSGDGSVTPEDAANPQLAFAMPEDDVAVKAVFVTNAVMISFDANGGSGTMTPMAAERGKTFALPENGFTAPEGKVFEAWAIGAPSGSTAKVGETYTFDTDTTLYAVWADDTSVPSGDVAKTDDDTRKTDDDIPKTDEDTSKTGDDTPKTGEDTQKADDAADTYTVTKTEKTSNALLLNASLKVKASGSKLSVFWGKVKSADGYEVYAAYVDKKFNTKTPVKTISKKTTTSASITKIGGKKLDTKKNCKLYITAYKLVNGKKVTIGQSITAYVAGSANKTYTNVKKVTLKKSKVTLKVKGTYKIQAKVTMVKKTKKKLPTSYCKEFRYASSNTKVATVTTAGKIKAVAKGKCTIYVYARNGYTKKVTVTVK